MDKARDTKILIMENHPSVREALLTILSANGYGHVNVCGEDWSVLNRVEEMNPDIVLLSIGFDTVKGIKLIRRLLDANPRLGIIVMSLNNSIADVIEMTRMGVKGYVTKTSSPEVIVKSILEVVQGRNYICADIMNQAGRNTSGPVYKKILSKGS